MLFCFAAAFSHAEVMDNTFLLTIILKMIDSVLASIVEPEYFNFSANLILRDCLPPQEHLKNLLFMPHEINPPPGIIIYKGNDVLILTQGLCLWSTPNVHLDIINQSFHEINCYPKLYPVCLPITQCSQNYNLQRDLISFVITLSSLLSLQ